MPGSRMIVTGLSRSRRRSGTMPQGRLLIGWMERDEAVYWLTKHCEFEPPVTDAQAEAHWREFRDRVDQLPARNIARLRRQRLNQTEENISDRFLTTMHGHGATNLSAIKINPPDLIARQLYVNVDRANEHRA